MTPNDFSVSEIDRYDELAKNSYFMAAVAFTAHTNITNGGVSEGGSETISVSSTSKFMCLKNTEFREGSRNPLPGQPGPTQPNTDPKPENAGMRNGVGLGGAVMVAVLSAVVFLG